MSELDGARILITGPTGQVGLPVAMGLAEHNEVVGPARTTWREGLRRMVEVRHPELFSD